MGNNTSLDDGRDDGRDMGEMTGEIKGGMKTLQSLYIKAFREIDGRDGDFLIYNTDVN